jgi:hypothetical protein
MLLGWSYVVRMNRVKYQELVDYHKQEKEGYDQDLQRMTRYVEASLELMQETTERARQLEAKGKRSEAAELKRGIAQTEDQIKEFRASAAHASKMSAHYAALLQKYEHAATRPWLPVPDDPPRPE